MINKKYIWILIPLVVLLIGYMTIVFVTGRVSETFNFMYGQAKIQNTIFRTGKLRDIRKHLDNGEIEKAQKLIGLMYETEIKHLELMLESEVYPEPINRRAEKVLAEIESGFDKSIPGNENQDERPN